MPPVDHPRREKDILRLFDIALVLKAIDGALEIAAAVLIYVVPPAFIIRIVEVVTADEVATDPNDFIATHLRSLAHSFALHTHDLIALYLALHGAVKLLLVLGIFAKKRFAYPLFMFALSVFGAYELYRGAVIGWWPLIALAAFDFMLLALTAYEYRRRYPVAAAA